jgi:hypothetical protein
MPPVAPVPAVPPPPSLPTSLHPTIEKTSNPTTHAKREDRLVTSLIISMVPSPFWNCSSRFTANACFVPTENRNDFSIKSRLEPPIVVGRQQSLTVSVNTLRSARVDRGTN